MSSNGYLHLSKVGARVLNRMRNPPKHLKSHDDKIAKLSVPEFLKSDLKEVDEADRYRTEQDWKYLPGDRVVVMKGKYKGNICVVQQHNKETNSYVLDDNGPTKTAPIPKQFWLEGQRSHVLSVPVPVKQEDIRLVADIDDVDQPGKTKTVAVADVVFQGNYYDDNYKKVMPYRCVSGQKDLVIPWPVPEPSENTTKLGTDPAIAREQTFWVDSIVRPPIPEEALLTVRNPHSKYRRGVFTAKEIARLTAPKMPLTDSKKAYIADKEKLNSIPRPTITDEEKQQIGEKIFQYMKSRV